ncbi:MAG: LppX_LprAFG lipoprotein [Candidatus Promineifilaceae bacterium]
MKSIRIILLALFFLLLASCGGNTLPDLSAEEVLQNSAETMRAQTGFRFKLDRDGALAYLDPDKTLAFGSAIGDFIAPDRARAQVSIIAPALVTKVRIISVAEQQWQTNILSGDWEALPPEFGFNPAVLFDAEIGIQSILTNDTSELVSAEPERINDGPDEVLYHITGNVSGERIYQLSGTLIGPGELTFEAWVAPETFELHRVIVLEPVSGGEEEGEIWQLDISEFGKSVEIEPPEQ